MLLAGVHFREIYIHKKEIMMATKSQEFKHVSYLWDDGVADQLDPVHLVTDR